MENDRYFSRSWALITRDKGWIKPLLVMAAATLVPIAGALGVHGYVLEWARLIAWGVDAAPKQKNVEVGKCIASGWRGFVVSLGWGLIYGFATAIVGFVLALFPGFLGALLSLLFSLAMIVISALAGIVIMSAQIRAAIYERIGAGYQFGRVFDMARRDTRGLVRVALVSLGCSAAIGLAGMLFGVVLSVGIAPILVGAAAIDESAALVAIAGSVVWVVVMCALFGLVFSFLGILLNMVIATATALWMRQFDVPAWGRSEDPLPGSPVSPAQEPVGPSYATRETQNQDAWNDPRYDEVTTRPYGSTTPAQEVQPSPWLVEQTNPAPEPVQYEPTPAPQAPAYIAPADEMDTADTVIFASEPQAPSPAPEPSLNKSVDELYSDLYDVISQNDMIDED